MELGRVGGRKGGREEDKGFIFLKVEGVLRADWGVSWEARGAPAFRRV